MIFRSASPAQKDTLIIFSAALAARALYIAIAFVILGEAAFLSEDSRVLLNTAEALRDGTTLLGFDGKSNFDAAVMPVTNILMALTDANQQSAIGFILLQSIIDSGSCVLVGLLVRAFFPGFYVLGGLIAASNPTQIVLSGLVLTDSVFFFFAMASLVLLVKYSKRCNAKSIIAGGLFMGVTLGLAVLTRTVILPWVPVAVVIFFLCNLRNATLIRSATAAVVVIVSVFLAIAPILNRNYERYGVYTVTVQTGAHLLYWITPLVADFSGSGDFSTIQDDASERLKVRLESHDGSLTTIEKNRLMQQIAIDMLDEFGWFQVGKAWLAGAALNLSLPAISVSPVFRSLPHSSFYNTMGEDFLSKVINFIIDDDNRSYILAVMTAAFMTLFWVAAIPLGLWKLRKADIVPLLIVLAWFSFVLAVNGPVASPKYRLPLEGVWVLLVVAAIVGVSGKKSA